MIRETVRWAVIGLLTGCGSRTVADDDAPLPPPPDIGAVGESGDPSEGEVVCRGELTACRGECVDLSSDDEHCGACDHVCKEPWSYGECLQGACPSALWCGDVDQGLETCDDVCALHGQVCYDGSHFPSRGCGGANYVLYFDHDALQQCEIQVASSRHLVDATCTTPIDWSIDGGWEGGTAQAVSCCCTQDLPS